MLRAVRARIYAQGACVGSSSPSSAIAPTSGPEKEVAEGNIMGAIAGMGAPPLGDIKKGIAAKGKEAGLQLPPLTLLEATTPTKIAPSTTITIACCSSQ